MVLSPARDLAADDGARGPIAFAVRLALSVQHPFASGRDSVGDGEVAPVELTNE